MELKSVLLSVKETIKNIGTIEIKTFCASEDNIKKGKRQPTDGEKISANHMSDKELVLRIYTELITLQQSNRKGKTTQFKNRQRILRDISPKKKCKWTIST